LVYAADRATKVWAEHVLAGRPIEVVHGALTLRYTTNSGGAFGLGQSAPWIFATATLVAVALIVGTAGRHTSLATAIALGLVLGGALGNLTDRLVRGGGFAGGTVVDFVDLHVWPVFNLADASIVVGGVLLAAWSMRGSREPSGSEQGPTGSTPGGTR
jgi:signal peptidase II